jgi:HlyD family secretion protein
VQKLKDQLVRDKVLADGGAIAMAVYQQDQDQYAYELKLKDATVASHASEQKLHDQQLSQLKVTLARLNANLAAARANLEALAIKAPMDGQLTALDAEVGQTKAQGAVLGQVASRDRFKLTAQVDEFYLSRVAPGQDVLMTVNGRDYAAKVAKVYPQVANGTFKSDFNFTGAVPPGIHNGQEIDLKLELGGGTTNAVTLPNGSFYQDTGGNWVFALTADGRSATRRDVRLGRRNPQFVEVLDGLKPGDRVIVSSYQAFEKMDRVELEKSSGSSN